MSYKKSIASFIIVLICMLNIAIAQDASVFLANVDDEPQTSRDGSLCASNNGTCADDCEEYFGDNFEYIEPHDCPNIEGNADVYQQCCLSIQKTSNVSQDTQDIPPETQEEEDDDDDGKSNTGMIFGILGGLGLLGLLAAKGGLFKGSGGCSGGSCDTPGSSGGCPSGEYQSGMGCSSSSAPVSTPGSSDQSGSSTDSTSPDPNIPSLDPTRSITSDKITDFPQPPARSNYCSPSPAPINGGATTSVDGSDNNWFFRCDLSACIDKTEGEDDKDQNNINICDATVLDEKLNPCKEDDKSSCGSECCESAFGTSDKIELCNIDPTQGEAQDSSEPTTLSPSDITSGGTFGDYNLKPGQCIFGEGYCEYKVYNKDSSKEKAPIFTYKIPIEPPERKEAILKHITDQLEAGTVPTPLGVNNFIDSYDPKQNDPESPTAEEDTEENTETDKEDESDEDQNPKGCCTKVEDILKPKLDDLNKKMQEEFEALNDGPEQCLSKANELYDQCLDLNKECQKLVKTCNNKAIEKTNEYRENIAKPTFTLSIMPLEAEECIDQDAGADKETLLKKNPKLYDSLTDDHRKWIINNKHPKGYLSSEALANIKPEDNHLFETIPLSSQDLKERIVMSKEKNKDTLLSRDFLDKNSEKIDTGVMDAFAEKGDLYKDAIKDNKGVQRYLQENGLDKLSDKAKEQFKNIHEDRTRIIADRLRSTSTPSYKAWEQSNIKSYRDLGNGYFTSYVGNSGSIRTNYISLDKLSEISQGRSVRVVIAEPQWCGPCRSEVRSLGNSGANYLTVDQARKIGWTGRGIPSTATVTNGRIN